MKRSTISFIEIHVATILLGGVGLFAKLIELPAHLIIYGRTLVAFCALGILAHMLKMSLRIKTRSHLATMLALGGSSLIQWVFFFKAIQISTVSFAVIVFTSYPIFISLLEPWLSKEPIQKLDLLCALSIFGAVYLAAYPISWGGDSTLGGGYALISGAGHALNIVLKRRYAAGRYPSLSISFFEHFFANILLLPFVAFSFGAASITSRDLILIIILGVCFSAFTRFLVAQSLILLSARTVGFIITLEPIYSILFASALLGEVPSNNTAMAGVIIVASIWVRQWRPMVKTA